MLFDGSEFFEQSSNNTEIHKPNIKALSLVVSDKKIFSFPIGPYRVNGTPLAAMFFTDQNSFTNLDTRSTKEHVPVYQIPRPQLSSIFIRFS